MASADAVASLQVGTSGGVTEVGPAVHPYFYSGLLAEPGPAALGMLPGSAVARARYHMPATVIAPIAADPVVTSNGDRLRFESFSGCCGVHARLDLLPDALGAARFTADARTGTSTRRCAQRSAARRCRGRCC
jgi:hypothetical protein